MTVRCPTCNRLTDTPHAANSRAWYCHHCRMAFEAVEDGDIGYGRPEKRLEREERARERKRHGGQFGRPGHGPYPSLDAGD